MANENGSWIMRGLDWDDPYRIRTWQELVNWINEIGFLPPFCKRGRGVFCGRTRLTGLLVDGKQE